jgi:CubicO group peptidase (beta-lactamase class C family)
MTRAPAVALAMLGLLAAPSAARGHDVLDAPARAAALGEHVLATLKAHEVPGASVAVFRDFEVEWARGFGVANADSGRSVDAVTVFQAASISKPVAALAMMRLVAEGRLDLDRDVNEYLKSWRLPASEHAKGTPITLRHLLSHTGGLSVSGFPGYAKGAAVPTVPQLLDGAAPANTEAVRVAAPPGVKFEYSGGGTTIAQLVLTDHLGLPFPELMRRLVLEPLRMRFSTYEQPLPAALAPFASAGHEKGKVVAGESHTYPEMAAAGLWTTATDLARFAIAVQKARLGLPGAVLPKDLANAMTTPVLPDSFGLGFELFPKGEAERTFFGHTGGNKGYRCWLLASRTGGHGIVILTNGDKWDAVREIGVKARAEYGW